MKSSEKCEILCENSDEFFKIDIFYMNKDKQYELYTQRLYQTLTKAYPNVEVLHNQTICGNQIDVCWRHNVAGVSFLTLVECKNYNKAVDLNCFRQLVYNMDALKARGVLVTTVGFQSGVIEAAKSRPDVKLLKVTFEASPGETLEFGITRVNDILICPDPVITTDEQLREWKYILKNGQAGDLILHQANGDYINTVDEFVREVTSCHEGEGWVSKVIDDAYIRINSDVSIKLHEIHYEILTKSFEFGGILQATKVIANVQDILTGATFTYRVEDFF